MNHPSWGQFEFVSDWGYLLDDSEGAVMFRGKFYCLIGEGKVLSFEPHLLIDAVLHWGC